AQFGNAPRGLAGGDHLDAALAQRPDQVVKAGLVIDADQCPLDRPASIALSHGMVTFLPVMVHPSRTSRPTHSTSWRRSASLMRSVSVSSVSSASTGTATCAMIGPLSTPASTKNSVAPATFTPYANASRGAWIPGNAGSNAL